MRAQPKSETYVQFLLSAAMGFALFYFCATMWPLAGYFLGITVFGWVVEGLTQGSFEKLGLLLRFLVTGRWKRKGGTRNQAPMWPVYYGYGAGALAGLAIGLMQRVPM